MILSDNAIDAAVQNGSITITPYNPASLGPNSYDLTLSPKLLRYVREADAPLDSKANNPTYEIGIPSEGYVLYPNNLYLASTNEVAGSIKYAPMVEGRSSYGRLGLDIHISAGFGDVGFVGAWTLEMRVVEPLKIYPNVRICQISFYEVSGVVNKPYTGKYNGSNTVVASKMHHELK